MIIDMVVDGDGQPTVSDIYRALVRNRAQLAYNRSPHGWTGTGRAFCPKRGGGARRELRAQDKVAQP